MVVRLSKSGLLERNFNKTYVANINFCVAGIPGMEWFSMWTQAYSAFAAKNDYASAIAQLKLLEENPVCKNNLVRTIQLWKTTPNGIGCRLAINSAKPPPHINQHFL
jgi:hypothetical protein